MKLSFQVFVCLCECVCLKDSTSEDCSSGSFPGRPLTVAHSPLLGQPSCGPGSSQRSITAHGTVMAAFPSQHTSAGAKGTAAPLSSQTPPAPGISQVLSKQTLKKGAPQDVQREHDEMQGARFLSCTPFQQDERLKSKERIVKVEMQASMVGPCIPLEGPLLGWGQRRHEALPSCPPILRAWVLQHLPASQGRWAAAAGKTLKWEVRGCD